MDLHVIYLFMQENPNRWEWDQADWVVPFIPIYQMKYFPFFSNSLAKVYIEKITSLKNNHFRLNANFLTPE